jgi:hypothetical protein
MKKFRVRLKGFNFLVHPPVGQALEGNRDVLQVPAVPMSWLTPSPKCGAPVPATWLLVDATNKAAAEGLFKRLLGVSNVLAPFVVEEVAA